MRFVVFALTLSIVPFAIGCGDDEANGAGGSGATGGTGGANPALATRQALLAAADDFTFENPPPTATDDCTVTLSPSGGGDSAQVNDAVEDASSWDVICFGPGTYIMDNNVAVTNVANLTVKGTGPTPADVILDYGTQAGEKGFDVTTPGFWIENLTIKNTNGNGIEIKADSTPENPTVFRKLSVFWDAGSVMENGAYSVYPTRGQYAVVEFCEVQGAADAGLYVGQMVGSIVRYNNVHANVAGLEVENSFDVTVYGNEVWDNAGGILALQEDGLMRLANETVLIRDNIVRDNNRNNFAVPGTTVSNIPSGTGMMSFAGVDIEFRNNTVTGNQSSGLLIVSNVVLEILSIEDLENNVQMAVDILTDPSSFFSMGYDPYPARIYANGNTFTDNGTSNALETSAGTIVTGGEAIIWDGIARDDDVAGAEICLGSSPASFRALNVVQSILDSETASGSTDTTVHECTLTELTITDFP